MDRTPQPDLNNLDRDALLSLVQGHQEELTLLIASHDEEIRRLEAELDSHRQALTQQADELRSRGERIPTAKHQEPSWFVCSILARATGLEPAASW